MAENDRLSGRVRRYAHVGAVAGSMAARMAGGRLLGIPLDKNEHAAELQAALGGLKGPLMKVAQILATVPDVLPEEYVAELAKLQTNAPS
ncbi:MAG: AarF/ABC1/UbiB kinase family protein, partial [Rhodospirillales bacterium]